MQFTNASRERQPDLGTHIMACKIKHIPVAFAEIRRPLVQCLSEPLKGDRAYSILPPAFPAGRLPGHMAKYTSKHIQIVTTCMYASTAALATLGGALSYASEV